MLNWGYLVAAALMAVITTLHCVVGGRRYVRPLLACEGLERSPRYVLYGCWHLVTMMLVAMTVGFAWSGVSPAAWEMGLMATALTVGAFVWAFALRWATGCQPSELPQGYLFLVASLPALAGLISSVMSSNG